MSLKALANAVLQGDLSPDDLELVEDLRRLGERMRERGYVGGSLDVSAQQTNLRLLRPGFANRTAKSSPS